MDTRDQLKNKIFVVYILLFLPLFVELWESHGNSRDFNGTKFNVLMDLKLKK